jgi:hypothetical protein
VLIPSQKLYFFGKEIFLEIFKICVKIINIIYSAEPAAKGTTTVMNMNHNTQAGKTKSRSHEESHTCHKQMRHHIHTHTHTHSHTSFSIFLLAILKTEDATILLSFSIAIIRPKIEEKNRHFSAHSSQLSPEM